MRLSKREKLLVCVQALEFDPKSTRLVILNKYGAGYIVNKATDTVFVRWTTYDRGIELLTHIHDAYHGRYDRDPTA